MKIKFLLHGKWKFKIDPGSYSSLRNKKVIKQKQWIDAEIPGTVHTDLLSAEIVPDPFYSDNESKLQWIGECDWIYKTNFDYPKEFEKEEKVHLIFEGLDTVADVYLNGEKIGHTENMFIKFEFDVSGKLRKKKNELYIKFTSAIKHGRSEEEKFGKLPVDIYTERVYLRKAQYSFGWDWGPSLATCGIWRPVYLYQRNDIEIDNITFDTISISGNKALVNVKADIHNYKNLLYSIVIKLTNGLSALEKTINNSDLDKINTDLEIDKPKLWWPNNYGEQNLYDLSISAVNEKEETISSIEKKVGIRTVILNLDNHGKPSFNFIINGMPIYIKGANWIPSDSFPPRISVDKYTALIKAAAKANMNMLRVWGGGFYEEDAFYKLCDESGILIWQDFMFACASYPEHEEFLKNVGDEISRNVYRLQTHPSIVMWCGNNENEWIWHRQQKRSYKEMPGYKIYHNIIPGILSGIDPRRPYWPSSPFGSEEDPNSEKSGNRHQWNIWSNWIDYSAVKDDKSLFVTEFGFQSSASSDTIKKALPKYAHHSQSRLFEYHNKQIDGQERLYRFMAAHLPVLTGLDDFVYLTQLNQGLALKECVEHWQSRFPETAGSLIWQLNDCWPVASWSLIDSDLIPKLSYYIVKRSFKDQIIFFRKQNGSLKINVMNNGIKEFKGILEIKYVHLPSGEIENIGKKKINTGPLSRREVFSLRVPGELSEGSSLVLAALYDAGKNPVNRSIYKEQEWKHIKLPDVSVKVVHSKKKGLLTIKTNKPAFYVMLKNNSVEFEDNGIIILPDEEAKIAVKIKDGRKFVNKFETFILNRYLKNIYI